MAEPDITLPDDDVVITFRTERARITGRLIRVGGTLQQIVQAHSFPDAVNTQLAEAVVLAGMFGSALPREGNLSLEARTSGPLALIAANYEAPGKLRGYARFDADAIAAASSASLAGGHVALTFDQGPASDRYQGIFALDDDPLARACARYFEEREGLPTLIVSAVARHYASGAARQMNWRAGALMMQSTSRAAAEDDEDWQRTRMLAATVESHELIDPTLSTRRLLLRLFHEEGVIVDRVIPLATFCRCSAEKVERVLASFGRHELDDLVDETGHVTVKCEFCGRSYPIEPATLDR